MPAQLAAFIFAIGIAGLFWLDRAPKARTSKVLWIAILWIAIAGSRSVGQWIGTLQGSSVTDTTSDVSMYSEGSPLDRAVYGGLLLAGLAVLAGRRENVWGILKANWPLVAFSLYCALSISWSDYPDVAFKRWIKSLGDFVMVMMILTDRDRYAAIKRVLAWTAFLLIPLSVLFIKFYPNLGRGYHPWTWTPYYTGVTTNKNELGRLCLVFGLGVIWRLVTALRSEQGAARRRHGLVFGTCFVMVLWLLWMAGSMTSTSCLLMAGALMLATNLRAVARRPWIVHAMVFAILAVSVATLFLDMGADILHSMGRDPTLTGRTEIWKLVLGMAGNPFVGTGFESFWLGKRLEKIWSLYWWRPRESHNGYLEMYLNLGWLGLVMFAIVVVNGYRTVTSAVRRNAEEGSLRLACFVVAIAYNFAESAFGTLNVIWIFFLLATMSVPGGWIRKNIRRAAPASPIDFLVNAPNLEKVPNPENVPSLPIGSRFQPAMITAEHGGFFKSDEKVSEAI